MAVGQQIFSFGDFGLSETQPTGIERRQPSSTESNTPVTSGMNEMDVPRIHHAKVKHAFQSYKSCISIIFTDIWHHIPTS